MAACSFLHGSIARGLYASAAALCLLFLPMPAPATTADYPTRAITLIVPWPAGGPTDVVARILAREMEGVLGKPVIVDNRPGANGVIGTHQASEAAPDGHTIALVNSATHSLLPVVNKKPPYRPLQDFQPVGMYGYYPFGIFVRSSMPVKSLKDFITYSKERKGGVSIAVSGQGTITHFYGEQLKALTGAKIVFIPYRGAVPAQDILNGTVDGSFGSINFPLLEAGDVKVLATSGKARWAKVSHAPTLIESGFSEMIAVIRFGLAVPSGTPARIAGRLNEVLNKVLANERTRRAIEEIGYTVESGPPELLWAAFEDEMRRFREIDQAGWVGDRSSVVRTP